MRIEEAQARLRLYVGGIERQCSRSPMRSLIGYTGSNGGKPRAPQKQGREPCLPTTHDAAAQLACVGLSHPELPHSRLSLFLPELLGLYAGGSSALSFDPPCSPSAR